MIGILALQGGVAEHEQVLDQLGLAWKEVRSLEDTEGLTGFIIPGGESTVMDLFMTNYGLKDWLLGRPADFPIYGTCAGLILLARYGLLPATVSRNAYGRQSASFVAELKVEGGGTLKGHFIRAPKITEQGEGLEVLVTHEGSPVLVRYGQVWGSSFHPELAGETRLHRMIFSC
ncbi:MAG: pyridoxal 5'-phosphate synthase glutaminase subunit PdxT [Candidatus Gracilibacteria bacterium]|jgi:5'-phosphate synthase pdxT subunit